MKIGRKIVICNSREEFEKIAELLDLKIQVNAIGIYHPHEWGKLIALRGSKFSNEIPDHIWKRNGDYLVAGYWKKVIKRNGEIIYEIDFAKFWIEKLKKMLYSDDTS